jgi:hypothetical protein
MERPATFANLWLILQTIGFIIALDGMAEYFSDRHYHALIRRFVILYLQFMHGLDGRGDPAQPRLPDSWEDWYNT